MIVWSFMTYHCDVIRIFINVIRSFVENYQHILFLLIFVINIIIYYLLLFIIINNIINSYK